MGRSLLVFWLVVYVAVWVLKTLPRSAVARRAFTWIVPRPLPGQTWASFQAQWAIFSFGWLCQIALIFSLLSLLPARSPKIEDHPWFLGLAFALALGAGIALIASLGFLFKAGKAHYFGPNPAWRPPPDDNVAA